MIETCENEEGLRQLEAEWRRLEGLACMRVFRTYDWCLNAWRELLSRDSANRLWIVSWHQDGCEDRVIFPFYVDRMHTLRFILDDHSDVCGCVCRRDVNLHWAFKEVAEAIKSEPSIRRVWLQKMDGDEPTLNWFGVFLRGALVNRDNAYSWLESGKCDDFILGQNQLKSKDRADLKGVRRKCEQGSVLRVLVGGRDLYPAEGVEGLVARMKCENRSDRFFPEGMREFTERIFNGGLCDILILERDGQIVALNFLLKMQRRYLSWIFLYSDPRTSSALYIKFLTEKARCDAFVFDFGVGVYDYKIGTFRPQTALTYSLRYSKTLSGSIADFMSMNLRMLKDWIKGRKK